MTSESAGQKGPAPQQPVEGDGARGAPSPTGAEASAAAIVLVAQALLDEPVAGGVSPPLAQQNAAGEGRLPMPFATGADAPLETAADPSGAAGSGGSSRYDSDFGEVIARLRPNTFDNAQQGTATPGGFANLVVAGGAALPPFAQAVPGGPANESDGDATGTGDGDTGTGGHDTGTGGDDTSASGDDSSTSGEGLPALFTVHPDAVDFNHVEGGSYLDGTQYDADNQNDLVILPRDAGEADEAGFLPGTLFLAGNGDDTVTGGTLADLIDGGNGQDLLLGGGSDDTLVGGNGSDTLTGGLGDDVMTGGNGKDSLTFSLTADEGHDMILDFTAGKGGDTLQIAGLLDVDGDDEIDIADLDAGGHSVSGTGDAVVITFGSGTTITLNGIDGTGIDSFADLVSNAKVNVDIL